MEVKLKMDSNVNKEDHDYALGHVHSKDKKGFLSMFVASTILIIALGLSLNKKFLVTISSLL